MSTTECKSSFNLELETNNNSKKDSDEMTWKYEKKIKCEIVAQIISAILLLVIFSYPIWMAIIIMENILVPKSLIKYQNLTLKNDTLFNF